MITKYYQISCDECCESTWAEAVTKKEAIAWARNDGFTITSDGKKMLCGDCQRLKNKQKK